MPTWPLVARQVGVPEEVEEAGEVLADLVEGEAGLGLLPHGLLHLQQVGALGPVEEEVYGRQAGGHQLGGWGRGGVWAGGRGVLALGLRGEGLSTKLASIHGNSCRYILPLHLSFQFVYSLFYPFCKCSVLLCLLVLWTTHQGCWYRPPGLCPHH